MRLRQLAVVTSSMAAMLLLGVHPALSQQRDSDKSITITYSGFGIYQHPERVTLYDWRNVKNWVYPELPRKPG